MSLVISGKGVQLEAVLREPEKSPPRGAAILCHPHPAFGGTMNNRVIYRSGKAALRAGLATLRFNFRGVGKSTGSYDNGIGEEDDVASAVHFAAKKYPGLPLILIGFSFGARVGLPQACRDDRVLAMIGLGLPSTKYDFDYLADNPKPALYISGTRDEFSAREKMELLAARFPASSTLLWVEGADHFFTDKIEIVQDVTTGFLSGLDFSGSIP